MSVLRRSEGGGDTLVYLWRGVLGGAVQWGTVCGKWSRRWIGGSSSSEEAGVKVGGAACALFVGVLGGGA